MNRAFLNPANWNKANCHPPMAEVEVLRTMDSIAGTALRPLFTSLFWVLGLFGWGLGGF